MLRFPLNCGLGMIPATASPDCVRRNGVDVEMKVEGKVNVGRHGCSSIDSAQTVEVREQEQEQRDERGSSHQGHAPDQNFGES